MSVLPMVTAASRDSASAASSRISAASHSEARQLSFRPATAYWYSSGYIPAAKVRMPSMERTVLAYMSPSMMV